MPKATPTPAKSLLTPTDHTLIMIDHQSQMAFATKSIDPIELRNNTALVANAAKIFNVSTILTTIAAKTFSGPIFPEILKALPNLPAIDRSTMNSWEDSRITDQVNKFAKNKIVICGLWTSVCVAFPILSAQEQGFETYFISDACGDISNAAHKRSIQRMTQAGAHPLTSLQYLVELQRDWARKETYNATTQAAIEYGGSYGLGLIYATEMFGAHEG